jgi:hypothetical protein
MRRGIPLIIMLLLTACMGGPEPLPGSEKDYPQVDIPGFSVPGKSLNVQREDVLLFDYRTKEETSTDLQRLSDDGRSMGDVELPWAKEKAVHVFATGRQIAVYVGSTVAVLNDLLKEGGEQIVGDPLPKGVEIPASSASSAS